MLRVGALGYVTLGDVLQESPLAVRTVLHFVLVVLRRNLVRQALDFLSQFLLVGVGVFFQFFNFLRYHHRLLKRFPFLPPFGVALLLFCSLLLVLQLASGITGALLEEIHFGRR